LLSPVAVVNPHAPTLGFSDRSTRHRRDNAKYLGLIRAVTLAHQHQRAKNQVSVEGKLVTYIEATTADVALAEGLCGHVLGTTTDELSPATRNLLTGLVEFCAKSGSRFTRRALRDATGLGDSQLKVHLARLVDLEYVAVERAGPSTSYELVAAAGPARTSDRPDQEDHRPGEERYRPGENSDQPVIGRFGGHKGSGPSSQLNGAAEPTGDLSAGIGRVKGQSDKGSFPQAGGENTAGERDRPALRRLHVTGDGDSVVVDRAVVNGVVEARA
jgi:hypothetical protein